MAIQVNLLPWREALREKQEKRSKAFLIAGVVIGLLGCGGYYGFLTLKGDDFDKATRFVETKIKTLEPKKKELDKLKLKRDLVNRQIDAIEALQENRASVTHMVEELSIAMPEEVFLNEFSLSNGGFVSIEGTAKNDAEIARLMTNLRKSEWYIDPSLSFIKQDSDQSGEIKTFLITSKLQLPGNEPKEERKNGN